MNSLRNSVRLIGNLGGDPEVKSFDKNKKMAKVSLATSETYTNSEGVKVTDTCWHHLVAWGKTASFVEKYLAKGSEIAVEGKITSRNYTDKDGNKKYFTEIIVNDILMLGRKSS